MNSLARIENHAGSQRSQDESQDESQNGDGVHGGTLLSETGCGTNVDVGQVGTSQVSTAQVGTAQVGTA